MVQHPGKAIVLELILEEAQVLRASLAALILSMSMGGIWYPNMEEAGLSAKAKLDEAIRVVAGGRPDGEYQITS